MIKRFLQFVEIQTKITSLLTFFLTLTFMLFQNIEINVYKTLIFFFSMLIFDLATTAINNTIDSKTNGQNLGFSRSVAKLLIAIMLLISAGLGIYLVLMSDLIVLLLGMFCFAIGILYTFGPIPISRQPYGEIVSGVLYGYFIPFIMIHVSAPHTMVEFVYNSGNLTLSLHLMTLLKFFLVFSVPTLLTASIMLANNTCDIEADVKVKRYTLPYYLGTVWSVRLMAMIYIGIYIAIGIAVWIKALPYLALLTLLSAPIVFNNFKLFKKDLIKHVSFVYIIKNFITVMAFYILSVLLGILFVR